jgi:hypothetical protein
VIVCPSCGDTSQVQRTSGVIGAGTQLSQGRNLIVGGLIGGTLGGTDLVAGNRSHQTTQSLQAQRLCPRRPRAHPILLWSFTAILVLALHHTHQAVDTLAIILVLGAAAARSALVQRRRASWTRQTAWLANSWFCHRCDRPFAA